jgi:Rad51
MDSKGTELYKIFLLPSLKSHAVLTSNLTKMNILPLLRTLLHCYRPHMRFGQQQEHHPQQQLYQYKCLRCDTLLKETESPIDRSIFRFLKNERCSSCGSILHEQTVVQQQQPSTILQNNDSSLSSSCPLSTCISQPLPTPTTFETAYDLQQQKRSAKLTFDIAEIDSLLELSDIGGSSICIASSSGGKSRDGCWHANNALVTRLCIRALMSRRHGGLESPSVIFVDAGNCSDIYQTVNFARQYGLDIQKVLDSIIVSRPFTIHQLAGLIIHELQLAIECASAKLVVVSDMLRMFCQDLQLDLDEVHWLLREIARSLWKIATHALVVISIDNNCPPQYQSFLPAFDNRIDIIAATASTTDTSTHNLQLEVTSRRLHYGSKHRLSLHERDLRVVPGR